MIFKHRHSLIFFVFVILFFNQDLNAQYFSTGNDPVSIRWKQIDQKAYKLLYPEGSNEQALSYARFIDQGMSAIGASMKHIPRKFPLILHSYSATSNGWTIWAPRRVELYPRPPIIGGAESYADHLLIHEIRHMIQMDKLNQGVTKAASYLLGDQAVAIVIGLHQPNWLSEGDAVLAETLLSNSGRGRQALFAQGIRTMWLSNISYGYEKALFGSYKDYVPNHYALGYHMVSMGRLLGGPYIWSDAIDKMGKKPYTIALLSWFMKKEIGLHRRELYEKTKDWMSSYWANQLIPHSNPVLEISKPQSDDYINYIKPFELDSSHIVLKKSLARIPEFVRLTKDGDEQHILYPGYIDQGSFSIKKNLLVWAEENPDPRWENRSYSNLYSYDLQSGNKRQVTKGKRLFAPTLNSNSTKIACLEYHVDGTNNLVILDAYTGYVYQDIEAPKGMVFQLPFWDIEGDVWLTGTGRKGKSFYKYSPDNELLEEIAKLGYKEVFNLVKKGNDLFFIGPSGGANALYGFNLETKQYRIVSEGAFGINYLNVGSDGLLMSTYSDKGYKPGLIKSIKTGRIVQNVSDYDSPVLPLIERVENEEPIKINSDSIDIVPQKYRKALHWFKFHSWAPASIDVSGYNLRPGAMLMSQNDLSTLQATFGAEYNMQAQRFEYYSDIDFIAWYPKVNMSARSYHDQGEFRRSPIDNTSTNVDYQYYGVSTSLLVPLNYSSGRWYRGVNTSLSLNYGYYKGHVIEDNSLYNRSVTTLGLSLTGYSYSRLSYRDLYPKYGIVAAMSTIGSASYFTETGKTYITASFQAYLPGIINNHSTRLYFGGYLNNDWVFPDQSPIWLPRGMYKDFNKYNSSAKIDYAFPFLYPDWNLGSLLYVKRLKTNIFCDAAKNMQNDHEFFMSFGLDLTSDFFFLRIGAEIDAGIRMIYNLTPVADDNPLSYELLFNFAIN